MQDSQTAWAPREPRVKKPWYKRKWFVLTALIFLLFVLIGSCGDNTEPTSSSSEGTTTTAPPRLFVTPSTTTTTTTKPKPTPKKTIAKPRPTVRTTTAPKVSTPKVDLNYGTCAQAKAAGKGPYYRGRDIEYNFYRDRDGDGVVCE